MILTKTQSQNIYSMFSKLPQGCEARVSDYSLGAGYRVQMWRDGVVSVDAIARKMTTESYATLAGFAAAYGVALG